MNNKPFTSTLAFAERPECGFAVGQNMRASEYDNLFDTAALIEKLTNHITIKADSTKKTEQRKLSAQTLVPACVTRISEYERDQLLKPSKRQNLTPVTGAKESYARIIENIVHASWLVIDYDKAPLTEIEGTLAALDNDDLYYIAHTTFSHQPSIQHKYRIWVPLDQPFNPQDYAIANPSVVEQAWRESGWELVRSKFLNHYAPTSDYACGGINHAYFRACVDGDLFGCQRDARVVRSTGTKCVSLAALMPNLDEVTAMPSNRAKGKGSRSTAKKSSQKHDHARGSEKHPLAAWAYSYGKTLQIERIFQEAGLMKSERSNGGIFVECDIEEEHSASEERTYVIDGDGETNFVLHCTGETHVDGVMCKRRDKLDRLIAYIMGDLISVKALESPDYGGGRLPSIIFSYDSHN
jgi:hypothetical protein